MLNGAASERITLMLRCFLGANRITTRARRCGNNHLDAKHVPLRSTFSPRQKGPPSARRPSRSTEAKTEPRRGGKEASAAGGAERAASSSCEMRELPRCFFRGGTSSPSSRRLSGAATSSSFLSQLLV